MSTSFNGGVSTEILNLGSQKILTIPNLSKTSTPIRKKGSLIYDSRVGKVYCSDGIQWLDFAYSQDAILSISSGSGISVDNTDPTNPIINLAGMPNNTILGNTSGIVAPAQNLTGTDVTSILDEFSPVTKGLVSASGGGTINYLRADGIWSPIPEKLFVNIGYNFTDATKTSTLAASGVQYTQGGTVSWDPIFLQPSNGSWGLSSGILEYDTAGIPKSFMITANFSMINSGSSHTIIVRLIATNVGNTTQYIASGVLKWGPTVSTASITLNLTATLDSSDVDLIKLTIQGDAGSVYPLTLGVLQYNIFVIEM